MWVTFVTKLPHKNQDDLAEEGIAYLGGTVWWATIGQIIESMQGGSMRYYTRVGGRMSWLVVVEGRHGRFVRPREKGAEEFNQDLLALPDFPAHYGIKQQ